MQHVQSQAAGRQEKPQSSPTHSQNMTSDGALISAPLMALTRRISALIEKGDRAADKAEQSYKSAGVLVKEIKQRQSEHWESIVRDKCGLRRSRAYELIAIADGKTTLDKVRDRSNRSSKISHAKKSAVQRTEAVPAPATESPQCKSGSPRATGSAMYTEEQHRARMAALDDQPAEDTVDEVMKRVNCVANTIRRHVDGLTESDGARFFATLRDMIDVVELAVKAGVVS